MSALQNQRIDRMQKLLTEFLTPDILHITDNSAAHIGHAGHQGGGHFTVQISSSCFQDKGEVECHRMVYTALQEMMQDAIHALNIEIVR